MSDDLPAELRAAVAALDLPAGAVDDVNRRAARRSRYRRRIGTTVLSVLVLAGAAGALRLTQHDPGSAQPASGPEPSQPTTTSPLLPPPRTDTTQLADRSPRPNEFPITSSSTTRASAPRPATGRAGRRRQHAGDGRSLLANRVTENLRRWAAQQPLLGPVDAAAGY